MKGWCLDVWIERDHRNHPVNPRSHTMVLELIYCPSCNSTNVIKQGKSAAGKQRYGCGILNANVVDIGFYLARLFTPGEITFLVGWQSMAAASETPHEYSRYTPTTVIEKLKKERDLEPVNTQVLEFLLTATT